MKLVYFRLNFISKSKALNLRQPKLSAFYKKSVAAIFQFFTTPRFDPEGIWTVKIIDQRKALYSQRYQ